MINQENEKLFNLQLIIQKLEEELSLYRKGTSGSQLLELIAEKDNELTSLKTICNEKNEKLKQLARSSADYVAKHQILQSQKDELSDNYNTLKITLYNKEQTIEANDKLIIEQTLSINTLETQNQLLSNEIITLKSDVNDRNNDIEKLQSRCAQLVSEKTEKAKEYEKEKNDRTKQIKEYRVSYLSSIFIITTLFYIHILPHIYVLIHTGGARKSDQIQLRY